MTRLVTCVDPVAFSTNVVQNFPYNGIFLTCVYVFCTVVLFYLNLVTCVRLVLSFKPIIKSLKPIL